jgi:hypothetical protein
MSRISTLAVVASLVLGMVSPAGAADPAVSCEAGKLTEAAKYGSCRLKAESKGVKHGSAPDFTACVERFAIKWPRLEAVAAGACPSNADQTEIDQRITDHADEIAILLSGGGLPTCGDAVIDSGEQCDSAALGGETCASLGFLSGALACDSQCFFDLAGCDATCGTCGNGTAEGVEQCDDTDLAGATCSSLGYSGGGTLACTAGCGFDTSGCACAGGGGGLPKTGQTTTYGARDDGDVQAGAAGLYIDNGDGTITDTTTGLMWEKKVELGGPTGNCTDETGSCANPHDADNRYDWSSGPCCSVIAYDGTVVTIFLEQLNKRCDQDTTVSCTVDADCALSGGLCGFAGYQDWRLPNRRELESIVDAGRYNPAINPAFNGASCGEACPDIDDAACSCTTSSYTWSSTTYGGLPTGAWYVVFYDGSVNSDLKDVSYYARAVRGGL